MTNLIRFSVDIAGSFYVMAIQRTAKRTLYKGNGFIDKPVVSLILWSPVSKALSLSPSFIKKWTHMRKFRGQQIYFAEIFTHIVEYSIAALCFSKPWNAEKGNHIRRSPLQTRLANLQHAKIHKTQRLRWKAGSRIVSCR